MGKIYQKMYLRNKNRSTSVLGGFIHIFVLGGSFPEFGSLFVKRAGFTLIELLVVVLIVGILAAVAVPQYQKAVWRSRGAEMMTQLRALGEAQQRYYMVNGKYAVKIDELDISYEGWETPSPICGMATSSAAQRKTKNYHVILHNTGTDASPNMRVSAAVFTDAGKTEPYRCAGLAYVHVLPGLAASGRNKIYCWYRNGGGGKNWCQKVWGATRVAAQTEGWVAYELP